MYRLKFALVSILAVFSLSACQSWLLIPSTGLREPIVFAPGMGQSDIDAGHVVDITGWCGDTRHLTGHRSSHGSVFESLPSLDIGDEVTIYENSTAKVYVLESVTRTADCSGVWGDLVLQTSHPQGGAYIFHLDRK